MEKGKYLELAKSYKRHSQGISDAEVYYQSPMENTQKYTQEVFLTTPPIHTPEGEQERGYRFGEGRMVDARIRTISEQAVENYRMNREKLGEYLWKSSQERYLEKNKVGRQIDELKIEQYQRTLPSLKGGAFPHYGVRDRDHLERDVAPLYSPHKQYHRKYLQNMGESTDLRGDTPVFGQETPYYKPYTSPLEKAYEQQTRQNIHDSFIHDEMMNPLGEEEEAKRSEIKSPITQERIPWRAIEIANKLETNQRAFGGIDHFTEKYLTTSPDELTSKRDFAIKTQKIDPLEEQQLRMVNEFKDQQKNKRPWLHKTRLFPQRSHPRDIMNKSGSLNSKYGNNQGRNIEVDQRGKLQGFPAKEYGSLILNAKCKLKRRQLDEGYQLLRDAVQKGAEHADVFYLFGETNRLKGYLEQAEHYLLRALTFQMHNPFTYNSLALVYSQRANYATSIPLFKHFIKLIETPEAHFELAKCMAEVQQYTESAIHLSRSIELDPNQALYYAYRADVYEAQGFHQLANADYAKILQIQPNFLQSYLDMAKTFEQQGNNLMANHLRAFATKILNAKAP